MSQSKRILQFHCKNCLELNTIRLLKHTIEDKNKIINLLEENLNKCKQKIQQAEKVQMATYASVVSTDRKVDLKQKVNIPGIIVAPNNSKQSSMKTKLDMENTINPGNIGVGVNTVKNFKNGAIIVKCDSMKSKEILRKKLQENMKENYEIKETKKKKLKTQHAQL